MPSLRPHAFVLAVLCAAGLASAQPVVDPAGPIAFKTVAEALASLESRDGNGVVVTHPDDWVVANEHAAAAQWSFVPKDHYAYPAVVRRVVLRSADQPVSVQVTSLCEAPKPQCDKLLEEFNGMNDRIVQSVRARSRQGSTPPR